jgi:hypothetical protein
VAFQELPAAQPGMDPQFLGQASLPHARVSSDQDQTAPVPGCHGFVLAAQES